MLLSGYCAALVTTLAWGSSFVATALLLTELTPLALQSLRFVIGALLYLLVLAGATRGKLVLPRRSLGRMLFVAVFGSALNSLGVSFAISYLGAGTSSLVIMLVPVLTGLLVVYTGQERLTSRRLQGFLLALVGLVLVVFLGAPGRIVSVGQLAGLAWLLAGALGFAIYNVYSRPLFAHYTPIEVGSYLGLLQPVSLLPFLIFGPLAGDLGALGTLSERGWLLAGYLALVSNVIAFLCWYSAVRALGSTRASLFSYLIPVWGLAGAALVLGERVTAWLPVGVALVVAGLVHSNHSEPASVPSPARGRRDG